MSEFDGLPALTQEVKDFISTFKGFEAKYNLNYKIYRDGTLAYEATERQYKYVTGSQRFRSYDSFKTIRTRIRRQKK